MKNNITFIIGLLCIILVTVMIDSVCIKQEGFATINCAELINMIDVLLQNPDVIKQMDTVNKSGMSDESIRNGNEMGIFFVAIDIIHGIIQVYPNIFNDIFNNPTLSDADFIVMANFYIRFIYFINNIRMIIILINPTLPTINQKPIPVTKNMEIINSKTEYDTFISNVNLEIHNMIDTLQSILNKINGYNTISSNTNVKMETVDNVSNIFVLVRDTKKICKGIKTILDNMPDNRLDIVSPYMNLINEYMKHIINVLNNTFVPALNAKIKDGAYRIQIDEISQLGSSNPGLSPIVDKEAPANISINIGSLLAQGLITAKP